MQFFIDTAFVDEIRQALELGILNGVITNPTLVNKTGRSFKGVMIEVYQFVPGPVSAEMVSLDAEGTIREGRELHHWAPNIVVKIPMTAEGLKAIKVLASEDIAINTALIFQILQALMAAKVGTKYVSPFVGGLGDISGDGMRLVVDIIQIFCNYGMATKVIVSSVCHPMHVVEVAKIEAHIATIPFNVIQGLIRHPLTDVGLKNFLADWEKVPKKPF